MCIKWDDRLCILRQELIRELNVKESDFKKGDIAFLPTEGSICFYMDDISDGKPMTIIGKIIDGIDKLSETKSSDILSLSRN